MRSLPFGSQAYPRARTSIRELLAEPQTQGDQLNACVADMWGDTICARADHVIFKFRESSMFKRAFLSVAVVLTFAGIGRAADTDDLKASLQKLDDSASYSWKTTVEGGFGAGETDGKTQKDGPTTLLTITRQDTTYTALIVGDKSLGKTDDGWKTLDELNAAAAGGGGGGGGPSPEMMLSRTLRNFKTPVAVAMGLVDQLKNVQKTDDGYTADLSDTAATQALTMRRRGGNGGTPPTISNAKASVHVWVKDGIVTKLENHVTGTVGFNGNDRDIDRTTTTEFSDVGSTAVSIPDDAKPKLSAPAATQP
jgi:hypothetical protein